MAVQAVGIDAIEIDRFTQILERKNRHERFFKNTFSMNELHYCEGYRDPAPHFAGTFAAKEAIVKVFGGTKIPLHLLEIRREKGRPIVWIRGKRSRTVFVSISHSRTLACAIALKKR